MVAIASYRFIFLGLCQPQHLSSLQQHASSDFLPCLFYIIFLLALISFYGVQIHHPLFLDGLDQNPNNNNLVNTDRKRDSSRKGNSSDDSFSSEVSPLHTATSVYHQPLHPLARPSLFSLSRPSHSTRVAVEIFLKGSLTSHPLAHTLCLPDDLIHPGF